MDPNKFSNTSPTVGVSACLLGQQVRFDGGHKRDLFLTDLFGKFIDWVAICPEVEVGMGVPRDIGAASRHADTSANDRREIR